MENLFNSPVMIKLQEFGQALGRNKYLSSLQGAMMSLMGVIMVGAISQILCSLGSEMMFGLFQTGDAVYTALYMPYNFTMNMLALWIVGVLAFNYARALEVKNPMISAIEALAVFMLIAAPLTVNEAGASVINITYLGSQGMFVGFIVAFVTVNVDHLCAKHNIYIRMPDIVPQFLQDGFAGIVPLLFNIIIFQGISVAVTTGTAGAFTICSGFMALLSAPLGALISVPGMFILTAFAGLLWCFGIHGTMITMPIIMATSLQAVAENGALVAAGGDPLFSPAFLFMGCAFCGGTGNTFPLVLMSLRSKSEQMRAVAKAGLIPGWFNINEPVTFGMPIMYNPVLCIPYVLSIIVGVAFMYLGYATGLLMPGWIAISALLPMGFAAFLSTLNPLNAAWDYLTIIPCGLVWLPFFKAYEKQLVAQEEEAKRLEAEQAAA